MKRKLLCLILALLAVLSVGMLGACDFFSSLDNGDNGGEHPVIDNSVDLNEYVPSVDDDVEYIEGETYYKSTALDLVTEVNGNYSIDRPFTLDKDNENKRIYHNVYFYLDDYFQVLYYKDVNGLGEVYAILSDQTDSEYAQVEYTPKGAPLQINITKQGVYDLVLDIETFGIDMVKVSDIVTPVYEKIKSCELNIHLSLTDHTYTPMELNEQTNEYYILAEIPLGASIGFYSETRNSHYKMTVDYSLMDTLVYWNNVSPAQVQVHVGGTYKIYFNAKTYVLRLELQNPDTASYYCQFEWKQNVELSPVSSSTPYLFEYDFVAQGKVNDPYVDIPSFYPILGMSYDLSIIDENGYVAFDQYLTESGTYKMTVNLKDFTLSIRKIS